MNTKSLLTKVAVPVLGLGLLGGSALALAGSASAATTGVTGSVTCTTSMSGVINHNLDVPAGSHCDLQWAEVKGNVSVEGVLSANATNFDRNVGVSGPGSELSLYNFASHFHGNLGIENSTGVWTGYNVGTSFFDNAGNTDGSYGGASTVDGNMTYDNSAALYIGGPLNVAGSFNASGNSATDGSHFDITGLTAVGGINVTP